MYFCDYPIIRGEEKLPVYLLNMGQHYCQDHIVRPDGFPHHQILYCTKGSGTLVCDGKKMHILPNTAIFMPKGYPHEYYPEESVWDIHWVVPSGRGIDDMLKQLDLTRPRVCGIPNVKALEHIFRKMHDAIKGDSFFGNYRASGYLYDFLIEFYRLSSDSDTSLAVSGSMRIFLPSHTRVPLPFVQ